MPRSILYLAFVLISCNRMLFGQEPIQATNKVMPVIPIQAISFLLKDVRLLDGPFKHAMELDQQYLLALPVGRLLHNFRINAGLPSQAKPLGGWEEPKCELRGHFVGHYLSACALMYASTDDLRIKAKGDSVIVGLAECQKKMGSGYLSAYPEEFIDRVETQKRVWAPYYTLHKIFAGLMDMYVHCGNRQALTMAKKFGDWVIRRNSQLSDEQKQKMLANEHGGMNETLANLYALTGEKKYLQIAQRFNHMEVIGPAELQQDKLTGLHANTQIPKFIGTARQYELTGDQKLKTASVFFWNTVVNERSYVIGGNSNGERFSDKEKLSQALGRSTTETCNTYNMLKLTRHLFAWDPKAEYMDYYERALYNHILASQNPETGMMCYYVPLRSGSRKEYNEFNNSFWCCTGTGVENHAKYAETIYSFNDQNLFINLYIASELKWRSKGLTLKQETRFPEEAATRLVFSCQKPLQLNVNVRHPYWAVSAFSLWVNGDKQNLDSKPGSWAVLSRTWRTNDVVEIKMPFSIRTEAFRDNPNRLAFLNGPMVFSTEIDQKKPYPAIVAQTTSGLISAIQKSADDQGWTFTSAPGFFRVLGEKDDTKLTFLPFYKMHGERRYIVYWDVFSPGQWQVKEQEYQTELARIRELDRRTVDQVFPGLGENEREHDLQGEKTNTGDFNNRKYRNAYDGGWFSYSLKIQPGSKQSVVVTYSGEDGGRRNFDILVDGVTIATQKIDRQKPDQFFDVTYALEEQWVIGKSAVAIKFQAHPTNSTGRVFGIRIIKNE